MKYGSPDPKMRKISRVNSEKNGFGSAGARKRWLVFVNGTAVDLTGIIKNAHYFWRDAICFPVVHFSALEDYSDKRSDLKKRIWFKRRRLASNMKRDSKCSKMEFLQDWFFFYSKIIKKTKIWNRGSKKMSILSFESSLTLTVKVTNKLVASFSLKMASVAKLKARCKASRQKT